jgi:hypothetical protein
LLDIESLIDRGWSDEQIIVELELTSFDVSDLLAELRNRHDNV